jgi:hypothetical protein
MSLVCFSGDGRIRVGGTSPKGPCASADMKKGDVIVSIDGTALHGKTIKQVAALLTAQKGVRMKLGLYSEGPDSFNDLVDGTSERTVWLQQGEAPSIGLQLASTSKGTRVFGFWKDEKFHAQYVIFFSLSLRVLLCVTHTHTHTHTHCHTHTRARVRARHTHTHTHTHSVHTRTSSLPHTHTLALQALFAVHWRCHPQGQRERRVGVIVRRDHRCHRAHHNPRLLSQARHVASQRHWAGQRVRCVLPCHM